MDIAFNIEAFRSETIAGFKGLIQPRGNIVLFKETFDSNEISFSIDAEHVKYFYFISATDIPENDVFSHLIVERWKIMNALMIQRHIQSGSLGAFIEAKNGYPLATLVGFPLIEIISQKWTLLWNDDGCLIEDIPAQAGLKSRTGKPKLYKRGEFISNFFHKFEILKAHIDHTHAAFFDRFDNATRKSGIHGIEIQDYRPLMIRLEGSRNSWMHGSQFNDDAPFVLSLVISLIYSASFCPKIQPPWRIG